MQEIWKDIPNYDGIYQVSNFGNLKSYYNNRHGISKEPKLLKPIMSNSGYYVIGLKKNKVSKIFTLHSIVALVFLGHKTDGTNRLVVDHIDENKLNNKLDNLQIITNRENVTKKPRGKNNLIGTSYVKRINKYMASIYYNKKNYNLGYFKTELDAHLAYINKLNSITINNN